MPLGLLMTDPGWVPSWLKTTAWGGQYRLREASLDSKPTPEICSYSREAHLLCLFVSLRPHPLPDILKETFLPESLSSLMTSGDLPFISHQSTVTLPCSQPHDLDFSSHSPPRLDSINFNFFQWPA